MSRAVCYILLPWILEGGLLCWTASQRYRRMNWPPFARRRAKSRCELLRKKPHCVDLEHAASLDGQRSTQGILHPVWNRRTAGDW